MKIHAKQLVFFSVSINKPVDLEVQAVLPETLTFFEALSSSSKGALNVCASPILPEGVSLAPLNRISPDMKERMIIILIE